MSEKHLGFKKAQSEIAKDLQKKGKSASAAKKAAGAILASSSRKASSSAKAHNPSLKKVK